VIAALVGALAVAQGAAALILLGRLAKGRHREPPVPLDGAGASTPTTVVVPVLNEAARLGPLLAALPRQAPLVREILVVDSGSADGTRGMVEDARRGDSRIRLLADPPLPAGWVGKAWALEHARTRATGEWLLALDADTDPRPELASAAVAAAEARGYDAVSFSPRFAGQSTAERFVQPSLLASLVYRTGIPGTETGAPRVLANGQCFLIKRSVLDAGGGYEPVRESFSEDVSLARHLARRGARVGFLDGSQLYDVRSYASVREMWREWGRSVDLRDATTPGRQWMDLLFLLLVQGLPVPLLIVGALGVLPVGVITRTLLWVSATLFAVRCAMSAALAPSYATRGVAFWISPITDPIAVLRVAVSTFVRPRRWRTRHYQQREGRLMIDD
jgi:dolichol-phosphate mannosyltransferase